MRLFFFAIWSKAYDFVLAKSAFHEIGKRYTLVRYCQIFIIFAMYLTLEEFDYKKVFHQLEDLEKKLARGSELQPKYNSIGESISAAFSNTLYGGLQTMSRTARLQLASSEGLVLAFFEIKKRFKEFDIAAIWPVLAALCRDLALYIGVPTLVGGVIGGIAGFFAGAGVGAVPGAMLGAELGFDAGNLIMLWMGLAELAPFVWKYVSSAFQYYVDACRIAWGPLPKGDTELRATVRAALGGHQEAADHFAKGHVIVVSAILMGLVAYVTHGALKAAGKGLQEIAKPVLKEIRANPRLGGKVADWFEKNLDKLSKLKNEMDESASGGSKAKAVEHEAKPVEKPKTTPKEAEKNPEKTNKDPKCCLVGKPVSPIFGAKVLEGEAELDFAFPAPLPLPWQRSYCSDNPVVGILGQGWSTPISLALEFRGDHIILLDPHHRKLTFAIPQVDASDYSPYEQLTLERIDDLTFELVNIELRRTRFKLDGPNSRIAPLVSITDRNGNSVVVRYNVQKQPVRVHDSAGRVFALQYNAQDRLEVIGEVRGEPDASGQYAPDQIVTLAWYEYNDGGDLIRVRNRLGQVMREFHYQNHMLIRHGQPGGLVSHYEYNDYSPQGKVTRNWTNTGQSWNFAYGPNQTIVTDHLGRREYYRFNNEQRYTGRTDALGGKQQRKLDKYGKPEVITDAAGRSTRYRYDHRSRVIEIEQPDGAATRLRYDERFDKPISIIDALGNSTTLVYDNQANLIEVTDALGQRTHYRYNEQGLPEEIIDAKGGIKRLAYNRAGQLTAYTDCSNRTTRFDYNIEGQLVRTEDAQGHATHYEYDPLGRLTKATYPDQSEEWYEYDSLGRLTAHIDAAGSRTEYQLDVEGRPLVRKNALGHTLQYGYDASKRLAQLVNENGAVYAFGYDPLDRLTEEKGFDRKVTRYRYDATGQPIGKEELGSPRESVAANDESDETEIDQRIDTQYLRDPVGRLTEKIVTGHNQERRTKYAYDKLGRLIEAENSDAKVKLDYDAIGQLIEESSRTEGNASVVKHAYDALGNRIQTILPDGRVLNQLFYGSGHLHQINLDGHVISDFERDELHREIGRTQGALNSHFQYDPVGRLKAQLAKFELGSDSDNVIARRYEYDKTGNLLQIDDQRNGTTTYRYDAIGRILQAAQPQTQELFAFDPAHNLIDQDTAQAGGRIVDNRVTVFEDKRFEYDVHGNLVSKKIGRHTRIALKWNVEHQLMESTTTRLSAATEQTTHYGYDPFGRRVFKRDKFGTTDFAWDGNRLLSETRGSHTRTYLYEPNSFTPLAQVESVTHTETGQAKAKILHFHKDHLGTPRELTDEDGNLWWAVTYKTWGNVLKAEMPPVHERELEALEEVQPLRFAGQYFDAETGLHFNRMRYYDPDIGRFISSDPIGLLGGLNQHQYASNPNAWIDPLGLMPLEKGMPLPDDAKLYRISTDGPYNFDFNPRELEAIANGKLNPPGVSVIRANSPQEATEIWNKAFEKRPATSVGELSAKEIREAGYDVIHDPSNKGRLGENHARLIHPDGAEGFNANKDKLSSKFVKCGC